MITAGLCFSCMNLILRSIDLPAFELVFFRSVGSAAICLGLLWRLKLTHPTGINKKLLIARALMGVTSMALYFKAVQLMPVGTAITLRYISPFFAAALAAAFLGEKMKPIQWLYFLMAFIGVALLKGFDTRIPLQGLIVILSAAFFTGIVYFLIRKIGHTEHPLVIITYFMITSTLVGGVVSLFNWVSPQGIEWPLLLSMGLFGFFGQWFMTKALQAEESNQIVPFKYTEVIFTMIAAWFILGEQQGPIAIVAITLIIAALIANVRVKKPNTKNA